MEQPSSQPQSVRTATPQSIPGGMTAGLAAAVAALACFLPWYRIDFSAMTSALDASFRGATGTAMPGLEGFGSAMSGMFGGLGVSGTINASGVDGWVGVAALVSFAVAAILHLVEGNAASKQSRGPLLVMTVVASILGAGFTLYSATHLGGPVGVHFGLIATVIAASAATILSIRRMQLFGSMESNGEMAG